LKVKLFFFSSYCCLTYFSSQRTIEKKLNDNKNLELKKKINKTKAQKKVKSTFNNINEVDKYK
jgi:hypothetical protein